MRKPVLLSAALLFFASCNHSTEPRPDTDRVIKDTLAQIMLKSFNEKPLAENIHVRMENKVEEFPALHEAGIRLFLNGIKEESQHFVVNPSLPVEVTGDKGVRVSLHANSFVTISGKEVHAPVDLELKESYSPGEMLLENLSSTTEDGVMESKGILHLAARAEGEDLKLKEGENIRIEFPFSAGTQGNYRFFYGNENEEGAVNWTRFPGKQNMGQSLISTGNISKPEFWFNGLSLKEYLRETLTYPDEAKRNELSDKVGVSFTVTENGEVGEVSTAESYKIFRDEIARVLKDMPVWKPASYDGKNISSQVHLDIDFNIRRAEQVKVDFNETEVRLIRAENSFCIVNGRDKNGVSVANLCTQSFDRLGWISYAHVNRSKKEKADVAVCADSKSDVRLILKNERSIVRGNNCQGYAHFKNIPIGTEAYVLAVRYDKGEVYYALQPVRLKKQTVVSLNWKKGNETEIKKVFKQVRV